MAGNGRNTSGSLPRQLQYGLDLILDQTKDNYKGIGDEIFQVIKTEKGFYEMMEEAGMGVATRQGEGEVSSYDSRDQHWVFRQPVYQFEKGARITRIAQKDNLYEDPLKKIAKDQLISLAHCRDIQQAQVLNNAFGTTTYGDGSYLCVTNHSLQTGGTTSNRLAVDQDFSEDALEQLSFVCDNMLLPNGLVSQYTLDKLIIPPALKFEAARVLDSMGQSNVMSNNTNALRQDGYIKSRVSWKRLSDSDAFFITTTAENGLILVRREDIFTISGQDIYTGDTILTAAERYVCTNGDFRGIVGTQGA